MTRKYEPAWKMLKSNSTIKVEITKSEHELVIKKHASTFVRGMQNEKYLDYEFRRKYPHAVITSEIDYPTGTITLHLELNNFGGLDSI